MKMNVKRLLSKRVLVGLLLAMLMLHLLGSVALADGLPDSSVDSYVWGDGILPPVGIIN